MHLLFFQTLSLVVRRLQRHGGRRERQQQLFSLQAAQKARVGGLQLRLGSRPVPLPSATLNDVTRTHPGRRSPGVWTETTETAYSRQCQGLPGPTSQSWGRVTPGKS